jgi:peptide/nickel transport system permease protein
VGAALIRLLGRRLGEALPLLLAISALAFGLIRLVPGGPVEVYLSNPGVRPEDLERLRRALGLDQPVWQQYLSWLGAFVTGDWGFSFSDGRPVLTRIVERVPASLELVAVSIALGLVVSVPVAVWSALRRGSWFDRTSTWLAVIGVALPSFWLGLLLQMVFAIRLRWLPSSGRGDGDVAEWLRHLILPASVLAFVHAAAWSRYLRSSLIDTLARPFLRAARARGVAQTRLMTHHALPNAIAPAVTVVLLDAALLIPGAVVTESVFAWPGVGSLFTEALARRDYTVLMAMLMVSSCAVVVLGVIADLVHAWLDPRVS